MLESILFPTVFKLYPLSLVLVVQAEAVIKQININSKIRCFLLISDSLLSLFINGFFTGNVSPQAGQRILLLTYFSQTRGSGPLSKHF